MDKYKIELTKDGKWAVKTKDYFWQRWRPVCGHIGGEPVVRDTIEDALRSIGFAWWKEFRITVDSIGVY